MSITNQEKSILKEAHQAVFGDRNVDYGHPYDDFSRTAKLWSAVINYDFSPEEVGLLQVLVKVSREVNQPKRDNRVDIAGYAQTIDLVHERADVLSADVDVAAAEVLNIADQIEMKWQAPTDVWLAKYEIEDGQGDTWRHVGVDTEGTALYTLVYFPGAPGERLASPSNVANRTAAEIYAKYGHPKAGYAGEIEDEDGFTWEHQGGGLYTYRQGDGRLSNASSLRNLTPERIDQEYGVAA